MTDLSHIVLTNYCYPDCKPLLNIMRLDKKSSFEMAGDMAKKHPNTTAFYRFVDFENYFELRNKQDSYLYQEFCKLGGCPEEKHPISFVVGTSDYLKEWFGNGFETVLRLNEIDPNHISFTIGDSGALYKQNGYVELLMISDLQERLDYYGGDLDALLKSANCHYIEAQLWSDSYIKNIVMKS